MVFFENYFHPNQQMPTTSGFRGDFFSNFDNAQQQNTNCSMTCRSRQLTFFKQHTFFEN